MALVREQFEIPSRMRTWAFGLMGIGLLAVIGGYIAYGLSSSTQDRAVFWGTLLYNSMYFTMVCNSVMFFICATTLAMASFTVTFRRVCDALSVMVPIFGTITFVLLVFIVLTNKSYVYQWLDPKAVINSEALKGKSGFLSKPFFLVWTILTIGLWTLLGARMRKLSSEADEGKFDFESGKSYIWRNTVTASLFIVWFALTTASVTPWFWIMSLNAKWYSTMYSWYTFASTFVAGVSLIALWVIYLKNKGYLEITNQEHLQDLGKFMFAFSIFWTYLWFSQYMLIWYANIPEETSYFIPRVRGVYKGIFFLNLIVNFVCPILILMKRSAKRNYTLMTFMCVLILFGHWIDFYQMFMGSLSPDKVTLSESGWFDFGTAALFVGIMIYCVGRALAARPLVPRYHPFLKESIVHHS